MKLIDKDALVAEIERRQDRITKGIFSIPLTGRDRASATLEYEILGKMQEFLDTIEVKEVDLKKEIDDAFLENKCNITDNVSLAEFKRIAKYFFGLGIVVSN